MQAETSRIDELLECLVFLTRFYGVPNSQDALTTRAGAHFVDILTKE